MGTGILPSALSVSVPLAGSFSASGQVARGAAGKVGRAAVDQAKAIGCRLMRRMQSGEWGVAETYWGSAYSIGNEAPIFRGEQARRNVNF